MPPRLGKQGNIIARALVAIGLAKIEQFEGAAHRAPRMVRGLAGSMVNRKSRVGQIGLRRNNRYIGNIEGPVFRLINDNKYIHASSTLGYAGIANPSVQDLSQGAPNRFFTCFRS